MRILLLALVAFLGCTKLCFAQNRLPSVSDFMEKNDANKDGVLTKDEVADTNFKRQFARWDADKDGKVSAKDIVRFRARFGIGADGSKKPARPATKFVIPEIDSLPRIDGKTRPSREQARNSAFILKTGKHEVAGTRYVILTDHVVNDYLAPLQKLADHHKGLLIKVDDLAALHQDTESFESIRQRLRDEKAKYVAIAPRVASFRENMLLSIWELFSTIDSDPQLDVLPGVLLATNPTSMSKLVEQSINWKPQSPSEVKPLAISQIPTASETRSLQKAGILRNVFKKYDVSMPVVALYRPRAQGAVRLQGDDVWNFNTVGPNQYTGGPGLKPTKAIEQSSLIVMHGHGSPGMSCSVDLKGLPNDLSGKILLAGSCFASVPRNSDLAAMNEAPGGYKIEKRDGFALRAVDNGAVVVFGHQRLSQGFPYLYPVLDTLMNGETVGESYQQLINGLINLRRAKSGGFILDEDELKKQRSPKHNFLYVLFGDPALQPFRPFEK